MITAGITFFAIGIVMAIIFVILMINFDSRWKFIIESLVGVGGNSLVLFSYYRLFGITRDEVKMISALMLYIGFVLSTVVVLIIMCRIIKDKDDADIIRIRDILLGQKSYIEKYYQSRADEIDNRLGIPRLEEKNKNLEAKEASLQNKEKIIKQEEDKIIRLGKKRLKINLPEDTEIIVTERFVKDLPSYTRDFFSCMSEINNLTEKVIGTDEFTIKDLKSYLLSIVIPISTYLFSSSRDIRIHFRYYDSETNKYEQLISLTGKSISTKEMTPIPYDGSMIKKSYECKRALIKSINPDYDYLSANNRIWKDYLTYAYSGAVVDGKPILTFGISVKNESRFREMFYYLNYIEIDSYLGDKLDQINQQVDIKALFYDEGKEASDA